MTPAECMAEYARRTNSHHFAAVAELIADDAVYWFSDGSFHGTAEIERAFERTWAVIQHEEYAIEDLTWIAMDEQVATCIYRFRWQGIVDRRPQSGEGRGTSVLRKAGTRWQMIHEHLSPLPA
jgi:ketosteroid isomerase-like protein